MYLQILPPEPSYTRFYFIMGFLTLTLILCIIKNIRNGE